MSSIIQKIEALKGPAERALEGLRTVHLDGGERFELFNAGVKDDVVHFGLFPRDLLTTALMLREPTLLEETIRFCTHTIGEDRDPVTGEEPGRVLHEWNRVERNGLLSHYNAAETSQLLLIAADVLDRLRPEVGGSALRERRNEIESAGDYVLSHIRDGLFLEDPSNCGASRYFAMVTYWKDSHIPGGCEPDYPVAYTLVQAQTVAALRSLARLTTSLDLKWRPEELEGLAGKLAGSIWSRLWDRKLDYPLIALDRKKPVAGVSSDPLHMLAYLEPGDIPLDRLAAIESAAVRLETEYGYRSYAPNQVDYAPDAYHFGAIWPYEQALIAEGARRFGREDLFRKSVRILSALERLGFPEIVVFDGRKLCAGGCDVQLWTCAVPAAFARLVRGCAGLTGRDGARLGAP